MFIHSLVEGHGDHFYFLAVRDKAALSIPECLSEPRVRLLDSPRGHVDGVNKQFVAVGSLCFSK